MDQASIYRQMAAKWLEIAERTPNVKLKRCYLRRAMEYRTLAASSETEKGRTSANSGPILVIQANEQQNKQ
jgi:hypothetical protein